MANNNMKTEHTDLNEDHDIREIKEANKRYLKNPDKCPFCNSEDISVRDGFESSGNSGSQELECNECGRRWYEIWVLKEIQF